MQHSQSPIKSPMLSGDPYNLARPIVDGVVKIAHFFKTPLLISSRR
jgi:hypothetical protein